MPGFRVDIHLARPMVEPQRPLLLDSLLEELAAARSGYAVARPVGLPLETAGTADQWVYKASAFTWQVDFREQRNIVRRLSISDMARDGARGLVEVRSKPATGTGPHRNYLLAYPVIGLAGPATAYGVGDVDAVRELLAGLHHLGAKRRLGHGEIARCDVTAVEDRDEWMYRPLPWADAAKPDWVPCVTTVRPPYYRRDQRVAAYAPVDLV